FELQSEEDARGEVPEREQVGAHVPSPFAPSRLAGFFLNISSIRCVTRKPPKTLTAASPTATAPSTEPASTSCGPAARIAPTMITLEMALVRLMSGVCSAGVT